MRQKKRMICVPTLLLLLLCIPILILTGCGMSGLKAENDTAMSSVRFVKATALAINRQQDYAEIFYAGDNPNINLEAKPFFQPSFTLKDFKASADSEDEDLIHYTCSVPGLVGTLYNMVYQTSYSKNPDYSPWVQVEGTVRVVKNENNRKLIDVSEGDNAFAAYASLRYMDTSLISEAGIDLSDGITKDNRAQIFHRLCTVGSDIYGQLIGTDGRTYQEEVLDSELESYNKAFKEEILPSREKQTKGFNSLSKPLRILIYIGGAVAILVLLVISALISNALDTAKHRKKTRKDNKYKLEVYLDKTYPDAAKKEEMRQLFGQKQYCKAIYDDDRTAIKQLCWPDDREVLLYLMNHSSCGAAAVERLPYPDTRDILRHAVEDDSNDIGVRCAAAEKLRFPEDRDILSALVSGTKNDKGGRLCSIALERIPMDTGSLIAAFPIMNSREQKETLKTIDYSAESKSFLQGLAQNDRDAEISLAALEKLPWPEEREFLLDLAQNDNKPERRAAALEKLSWPEEREALLAAAREDKDLRCRKAALKKLPWLQEPEIWVRRSLKEQEDGFTFFYGISLENDYRDPLTDDDRLKASITLVFHPSESNEILTMLCQRIQEGLSAGADTTQVSLAGWSAAALGRILTKKMSPQDIESNQKRFSLAMEQYNSIVNKLRLLQEKIKPFEKELTKAMKKGVRHEADPLLSEMHSCQAKLDRGLGMFMLDNGDKPFSYLIHIMGDNQSRVPRFVKQGVIMGLLDWLSENADDPEAKKLLENVIAVRADLIRSDNDLSFFEVRVPSDCSREEYGVLLKEVLHCANPSVRFADTKELLSIAEAEVPGCMDMLRVCPMRLIDPVNRQTLGFYKFKPYIHAMWVQYQPPQGIGKVMARYHEVDDRTKPLSSGLNLQLFRDPYAVIPTLFHEYQHFKGDPNEASVFLKTQIFSIRFYKKYKQAKAAADGVFTQMTSMLGMPPEAEKLPALNAIIERCYGKQTDKNTAEVHATQELQQINDIVNQANSAETWDPDVRFPLLTKKEDKENAELIHEIIVRFDTVPKSITEKDFQDITDSMRSAAEHEAGESRGNEQPLS